MHVRCAVCPLFSSFFSLFFRIVQSRVCVREGMFLSYFHVQLFLHLVWKNIFPLIPTVECRFSRRRRHRHHYCHRRAVKRKLIEINYSLIVTISIYDKGIQCNDIGPHTHTPTAYGKGSRTVNAAMTEREKKLQQIKFISWFDVDPCEFPNRWFATDFRIAVLHLTFFVCCSARLSVQNRNHHH